MQFCLSELSHCKLHPLTMRICPQLLSEMHRRMWFTVATKTELHLTFVLVTVALLADKVTFKEGS